MDRSTFGTDGVRAETPLKDARLPPRKVLFVCPWVPSRLRPRSLGLLKILLSAGHSVSVVALTGPGEIEDDLAELGVRFRLATSRRIFSFARAAAALPSRKSLQTAYCSGIQFRGLVRAEAARFNPDVVHFNVLRSTVDFDRFASIVRIVDLDDIRSDYYRQVASDHSLPSGRRAIARLERPRMKSREAALAASADAVLLSSPAEAIGARSYVIRTPMEFPGNTLNRQRTNSRNVLFVGKLDYEANVEAVLSFVRDAWPAVFAADERARLHIVGANPPDAIRSLVSESITVHADVPAVWPFYDEAAVAIVPVESATGVQMKLLQAFVAGVPVVASSITAAQAGLKPGNGVLVAESGPAWANAVIRILRDQQLRVELVADAYEHLKPWAQDQVATELQSAYRAAVVSQESR